MMTTRALAFGAVLAAIAAAPAFAAPTMPERFALLGLRQVAFMCSYALLGEATRALQESDTPSSLVENALRHITAARAWDRVAVDIEPANAKRWQVAFDGQGAAHKSVQMDYCYSAGIDKLHGMAEAEANLLVDASRLTVRKLLDLRVRRGH